jgi:archaellum component FlaC
MQPENIATIVTDDLPHMLNELSLSYSMLFSADESLEELEKAVKELKELVAYLREEIAMM